ncbi:methylenetetrahydrofolate reductase [Salinisphaera aquimarina]|uniref:Methylenetetrahydrofolate reductase n=1 Tax=Salinisphaera aquimarina TaxID=2094031 RepID=A0ABV7ER23_9GAMM
MTCTNQSALRRALLRPRYEIIPMRGALDQARKLAAGAVVTVTCSPSRGVQPTIELAEQLAALGHVAIPHLAARRFRSRTHLQDTMARLDAAGVQDVFVVGGDGTDSSGAFTRGADLVAALAEISPGLRSVGIPCYPEGHAFISAQVLDDALDEKRFFAGHMITQMCFDPAVIRGWLERSRARGMALPVYIGIPGVIERRKLLSIALRIGLGDSTRFLRKNGGVMGRLAGPSCFTPDALIDGLGDLLDDPRLNIAGLHINTFNQIDATEAWRRRWLDALIDTGRHDEARTLQAAQGRST